MKRIVLLCALFSVVAYADGNNPTGTPGTTPVAVVSSQAATTCVESNVAAAAQATATVPGQAGLFFYVTNIDVELIAIAAPAATLMATTSTNLPGSFSIRQAVQAAVGTQSSINHFAIPLKSSAAGTATVLTGPSGLTSVSQNIRVCGFYAL